MTCITSWGHVTLVNGKPHIYAKSVNKLYISDSYNALKYYKGISAKLLDKAEKPNNAIAARWLSLAYAFSVDNE